jgi:hypothetical protein
MPDNWSSPAWRVSTDLITERILQTLARGVVPWHQPWTVGIPRNLGSRRPYRGINVWLTASAGFASPYWLTFNQAKDLGGSIQRAAKGTPVVFWKWCDTEGDGEETNPGVCRCGVPTPCSTWSKRQELTRLWIQTRRRFNPSSAVKSSWPACPSGRAFSMAPPTRLMPPARCHLHAVPRVV